MDMAKLASYGRFIEYMMEGSGAWQLDRAIDEVLARQDWELLGHIMLTASEVTTQRCIRKLLELNVYEPLVWVACMRRQQRRAGESVGARGVAGRVFRDWEAESGGSGVPEHIRADAEEMSRIADQTRAVATAKAADFDRDPVRHSVVNAIAERMPTSRDAVESMLVIVKASAWDETRRSAAMKIATHALTVTRLARAQRMADLMAVAAASGLAAIGANMARAMGPYLEQLKQAGDTKALQFIADNHPDDDAKAAALQALGK
jgi:hypothetical protein